MSNNFTTSDRLKLELLGEWSSRDTYGDLTAVNGYEAFSELFGYQLKLLTANKNITKDSLCNKSISFRIKTVEGSKNDSERIFNGVVKKVNFIKKHNPQTSANPEFEYYLQVVPKMHELKGIKHSKVFHKPDQTILDIIEKILKEYKVEYKLNVKSPKIFAAETCIQYNESDYEFVTRLLQEAGLYYFFQHEKDKHTLIISDQATSYLTIKDKQILYIDDKGQASRLYSFVSEYSSYVSDFTVKAFSYAKPEELVEESYSGTTHKKQEAQSTKSEKTIYTNEIKDTGQIKKLAESFGNSEQVPSEQVSGRSNYISFAAGGKFTLEGKFFENMDKKDYVITELRFEIKSDLINGPQYQNSFTAIAQDKVFVPKTPFFKPVISGLHFAMVVDKDGNNSSQEPYCDEKGCVYIKLLWGKEDNLCKANVLSTSHGFTLPRIGSLAYVFFPNSSLYNDIPVIVGISNEGLLNFKDNEDWYKNIYMTYPATSDKEIYNFMYLKDKKDNQEVKLYAKKDMIVDVTNDETITINHDSTKLVKNIRKVTIKEGNDLLDLNKGDIVINIKEGKYNLYCKGQISIKSDADITIDAKSDLNLKSGGKISLESKSGIAISTKGDYKLESVNAEVKANSDLNFKSGKNINQEAGVSATYKANASTTIKSNAQISIESTATEVKGKANLKVSSPMTQVGM
jgi:type VI secretion system secreted protein VgrG